MKAIWLALGVFLLLATAAPIAIFGTFSSTDNIVWMTLGVMATGGVVKRATAGFIVSLIAGILILINAIAFFALADFIESLGGVLPFFVEGIFETLGAAGAIIALVVILGGFLIYMPGKETIGGIIVIIFSILSIFIGGGFLIGLILGIIGGILGLAKK